MSRPLLTFSTLSLVYGKQQQQDGQQQPVEKKKIKIKPKNTVVVGSTNSETEKTQEHGQACSTHSCEKVNECEKTTHPLPLPVPVPVQQKKKIIIIKKRENVEEITDPLPLVPHLPLPVQKKKIIIMKKRENVANLCHNDIAPPATMICKPRSENDLYHTVPPQRCCRFFIKNKQCFLRERDSACISPISRTVFGFWNEKVGKECKLLPIEDETAYEEEITEIPLLSSPVMKSKSQKSPKKIDLVTKSRFVSDAQRARVASEPVALLREKIAKQYGMIKKN